MPGMPLGTITFLFTDIEGSTRMWDGNPSQMGSALARHDAILRESIERFDGHVFKTVGDAFCASFHTASNALDAATCAQLAIHKESWPPNAVIKVRMALHTGTAEVRDNDYFGQPLNRVARLLSVGHGGQVLLSMATQELVRDSLTVERTLQDMGERRLKDLIRPERIYQVVQGGLQNDFPALKTLETRAHNLPIQLTSFVGREREIRELRSLTDKARLITITGTGGAGKTRLSLQLGADLIDNFADGVWLVEFATISDAKLIPQAVATALGIREEAGISMTDTLLKVNRDRKLLLILDNCEHVVEMAASLCGTLLEGCPGIQILATSREALRVGGESVYPMPSLPSPDPTVTYLNVSSLTQYAAIQLFIERAVAVKPSFEITNTNAAAVASICHNLDGIPLAIELAAARIRSMSAEEVNKRLDHRFQLLTGGARTALPRQQTLRALIDWSYDLLNAKEQVLLRRLAAFSDGWTLEAAEQVCSGATLEEWETLDLLTSLTDKSLVFSEEQGGSTRYRMLLIVREYAHNLLTASDENLLVRKKHFSHFLDTVEKHRSDKNQRIWLELFERENGNLRSALAWSLAEEGETAGGLKLAGLLPRFWYTRGYLSEGRQWLSKLLEKATDVKEPEVRAKALHAYAFLAISQIDYQAAKVALDECLAIRRASGDQGNIAETLLSFGTLAWLQGDLDSGQTQLGECLDIFRTLADLDGIALTLNRLGALAQHRADYSMARKHHEESLAISRKLGNQLGAAAALNNMGHVAVDQKDFESAKAFCTESLVIRRVLADRRGLTGALQGLAYVAAGLNDPMRAARLAGASEHLREKIGLATSSSDQADFKVWMAGVQAAVKDRTAFESAWNEGHGMTLDQAMDYALAESKS